MTSVSWLKVSNGSYVNPEMATGSLACMNMIAKWLYVTSWGGECVRSVSDFVDFSTVTQCKVLLLYFFLGFYIYFLS